MEISLFYLPAGRQATITRLEGGLGFQKKLAALNIRIGKTIKKITVQPLKGPVVIEIDHRTVTLGMVMAKRIFVKEEE